ncbi:MAG: hypothetical protein DRJ52_04045 [Thermoprotei archaeon]|nr:MAG: hypothetical protein DRJ52_04045 [Thermoprotei archaeon]RLE97325.1 MAG: hypothetical protein DRJ63_09310 [Thermoprotei archaeon]
MEEYIPVILAAILCCVFTLSFFKTNYYSEADVLDFITDIKYATMCKVNITKIYYFSTKITLLNGSVVLEKPLIQYLFPENGLNIKAPIIIDKNVTLVGLVKINIVSLGDKVYIKVIEEG